MMPKWTGTVCRRLKAEKVTENILVFFITALDKEQDGTLSLDPGAMDYSKD
jgi:DNA-binding response OmpR family regulator